MEHDTPYVLFGKYSVRTSQQEVLDKIGHCREPSPTGHPVFIYSGQVSPGVEPPNGALLFSYPDHASEVSSLLGVDIPGEPDGSSGGLVAGTVVDLYGRAVPQSVTATQIRLWLVESGVSLATVGAAISAIPGQQERDIASVYWEYAPYIERDHSLVAAIGEAMGMSAEQIDEGFREASLL
jgi:hypothetical protein